jgi:Uma2 family endonuclease
MSNAADPIRPVSADELYAMGRDDRRYELVAGALRVHEPTGWIHGEVQAALLSHLRAAARAGRLGSVVAEVGFVLARQPDTVRAPDVAFLRTDRLPAADRATRFIEGAPDLAIEVVSPDDRAWEIGEKVEEYLASGTRLVWVVDPRNRHVVVHTPDRIAHVLRAGDALDGADVVPGCRLGLDDLFAPA